MILEILLIIVSLAVVLWGADHFTDGGSDLARRLKVSELVIGLTVVAIGTSIPEFMVSLLSLLRGSSDMSVGNIIGSNVFNILVIIGASSIMRTMKVEGSMLRRDLPICFAASVLFCVSALTDGEISQWEGLILVVFFCTYLYVVYRIAEKDRKGVIDLLTQEGLQSKGISQKGNQGIESEKSSALNKNLVESKAKGLWHPILTILVGMVALVIGGRVLVNSAVAIAKDLGVSESVIGATILAGGTSLPELATSIMAARKGSLGLAFGNVLGSNIFNIVFVIGFCSSVVPMAVAEIQMMDWIMLVGSCIVVWIVAFTRRELNRLEGILLVICYLAYLISLLTK